MSEHESDRLGGVPHPRFTARLYGQEEAEARFLDALGSDRLPHGWMLTGPRGVGKATLAWRIARCLLAGGRVPEAGTLDMDPGDPVFRQVAALSAPRLFLCRRPWDDKAKRLRAQITVDEVRALKSFFQMSAAEGGWRVAIVDAADEMNIGAANALLKVLEEPPERAALLLVCHQPGLLPPTIRSRCRVLRCGPVGADDLARALDGAGISAPAGDAAALRALAGGSVGDAARLIAGNGIATYAEIFALLAGAPGMDRRRLIALAESCAGRDSADRYAMVLDLFGIALSRLALAGAGSGLEPVSGDEAAVWERLAAGPGPARLWSRIAADLLARAEHGRAVHLDPAQVILDTCLRIDTAATEARIPAHGVPR